MQQPSKCALLFAFLVLLLLTACDALKGALPDTAASLTVSAEPDGSSVPLGDAVLYGNVFIHAEASGIERASFYLDDRERAGSPLEVVTQSPFRLTFDTSLLADGPHTLTLELTLGSGETTLSHAAFTINNAAGELLEYVNLAREKGYDCGSEGVFAAAAKLKLESRLISAAQKHAADMNEYGYLSHTGRDGSTVSERVNREGYTWSVVGENLAEGFTSVPKVVKEWLGSDGHCANFMNPAFTELGVGRSGDYWATVLARPQ